MARATRCTSKQALDKLNFAAGSMVLKVQATCKYVQQTGGIAGIGHLQDTQVVIRSESGTLVTKSLYNR
jgi:carbamate kinase